MIALDLVFAVFCVTMVGYLVGSTPIGYLIIYRKFGIDLLRTGSGGIGATNSERALLEAGVRPNVAKHWRYTIELLDQLKGFLPVLGSVCLLKFTPFGVMLLGIGLILGHCYSFYLGYKGGKGVATSMGIALAICPWVAVPCYLVWFVAKKALAKRTAEATALASIRGGLMLGLSGILMFQQDVRLLGLDLSYKSLYTQILFGFIGIHMVFAHRQNLKRYKAEQQKLKLQQN